MAIASPPKPKAQHKKRLAQHHRQTKHYMKSYWPYLPMVAVVGGGLFVNQQLTLAPAALAASSTGGQAAHGSAVYFVSISLVIAAAVALSLVVWHHSRAWHRVLVKGEQFALHHALLDVSLVGFVATSLLLHHALTLLY